MTTLDKNDFTERIEKLLKSVHNFGYNNGLVEISKKPELRYIEATQALKTLIEDTVMEIIGNSERIKPVHEIEDQRDLVENHHKCIARNELRATQREKLNELLGKDKK